MKTISILTLVSIIFSSVCEAQCSSEPVCLKKAGPDSEKACANLADDFKSASNLKFNNTFSQYFPEGSMPSLEALTALYPNGTIPKGTKLNKILLDVGPDFDIKSDGEYGRVNSKASKNGPLGSMPAFCRFGAFIETSPLTKVLMEVWMPLMSNPSIPLVNPEQDVTDTTAVLVGQDGKFERAPLYFVEGKYETAVSASTSSSEQAKWTPNDIPVVETKIDKLSTKSQSQDKLNTMRKRERSLKGKAGKFNKIHKHGKRDTAQPADEKELTGEEVLGGGTGWNGRLMSIGNGGQRGFVPLADLKQVMTRYGFAVTGNNGGHFSTTAGVTWVNGSQFEDTLLDWASRANHVSLKLSEEVIDVFYGKKEGIRVASDDDRVRRYYAGSSVGGARGFSAMQVNPEDYHGYLIGAAAIDFVEMNIGQLHTQKIHNKTYAQDGWFTQGALFGPVRETIMAQCDKSDGVEDGVISYPFECKFKLEDELLCEGKGKFSASADTCLTQVQIDNVYSLYKEATLDGELVYPAYLPGLEDSAAVLKGRSLKASHWNQLVVYKQDQLDKKFNPFTDITYEAIQKAKAENPGKYNADDPDLTAFLKSGAKAITYHGTSDLVVSPRSSTNYYEKAVKATGDALKSAMKLYMIPSMLHSRGGRGAIHFGGITHIDVGNRPLKFDTHHDMILAIVAWVEQGQEPKDQVAATYTNRSAYLPDPIDPTAPADIDLPIDTVYQNYNWGVVNTRILCPYPQKAIYKSGTTDGEESHKSFECA